MPGIFWNIERFVGFPSRLRHALTEDDYRVLVMCPCGATFDHRVTQEDADADLLRSSLRACPN